MEVVVHNELHEAFITARLTIGLVTHERNTAPVILTIGSGSIVGVSGGVVSSVNVRIEPDDS